MTDITDQERVRFIKWLEDRIHDYGREVNEAASREGWLITEREDLIVAYGLVRQDLMASTTPADG